MSCSGNSVLFYWYHEFIASCTLTPHSEEVLNEHAYSTAVTDVVFHGRSRLSPGIGLDGGDIVKLNLAYNKDTERILVADRGTRSVLKEYALEPARRNLIHILTFPQL